MRARRATSELLLAAALASACPKGARADEPPPQPPAETPEEHATRLEIEPPVYKPPWSGREAIWGGVGLIVAGAATLIVVTPTLCTSSLFSNGVSGSGLGSNGPSSQATCLEATVGGGAGAAGLGVLLLIVGETQRATYKEWLRAHPMFAGLSVTPGTRATSLGWSAHF